MAENWKNCFEEELICPICLHVFVEPVQLPCKHNFCRGCIGEAWAKESGLVRCPECNQAYNQKPNLEKNLKLTNIVEKFNSLNLEKPPSVLHCVFCRRGPPLPAQKICLRCEAPCCQSHVQTHLQQPSTARGHLLVEADDVRAWSCPQHNAYRLYHCEAEQVAVCQFCCYYSGAHQGHSVCDVEIRRNEIRVSQTFLETWGCPAQLGCRASWLPSSLPCLLPEGLCLCRAETNPPWCSSSSTWSPCGRHVRWPLQPNSDGVSGCWGAPWGWRSVLWVLRSCLAMELAAPWAWAVQGRVEGLGWGGLEGLFPQFLLGCAAVWGRQGSHLCPRSGCPEIRLAGGTKQLQTWTPFIVRPMNVKLLALPTPSRRGRWPPSPSPLRWESFMSETHGSSLAGIRAWGFAK